MTGADGYSRIDRPAADLDLPDTRPQPQPSPMVSPWRMADDGREQRLVESLRWALAELDKIAKPDDMAPGMVIVWAKARVALAEAEGWL